MTPLAWLPLVVLLMEQAFRRASFTRAIWAGGVFALIVVAAHPQITLYAGLFLALWTLGPALERAGYFHRAVVDLRDSLALALARWAGVGVCTALTAAALAAVQLLPALEAAGEASRGAGVPASELLKASLPTLL